MNQTKKSLSELELEKEQAKVKLSQALHQLQRLENKQKHLEKGERAKRTHRLCNIGGAVESVAPEIKEFSQREIFELMEDIFSKEEIKKLVHHIVITHTRETDITKEVK